MPGRDDCLALKVWVAAAIGCAFAFQLAPGIDLWVSGLFHHPGKGFPLADWALPDRFRLMIWDASKAVILAAVLALGLSAVTGRRALWLPARAWSAILAVYVIGPGMIANLWLKAHWGRARPDTVEAFGGTRQFSPPLTPADECARNCSFVSGEGAAAAALLVAAWIALRHLAPRMSPEGVRLWLGGALAVAVLGGVLRIAAGRHFLSDVVFAWLVVIGVALVVDRVMPREIGAFRWPRMPRVAVLTTPATPPIRRDT